MGRSPDVVVVGAGVVGASCAYYLAAAGVRVRLYDRSFVASGSSGACEGNVLAWDKELERELPLALRSGGPVAELAAASCRTTSSTTARAASSSPRPRPSCSPAPSATACSRASASQGEVLDADALRREEPHAAHDLPGGVLYPGDAQLEPRLATAALVARPRSASARSCVDRRHGQARSCAGPTAARPASRRSAGRSPRDAVVVAAGVWTPDAARDRRPDGSGHAAQGPDRRARALAGASSAASSARPATSPPSRPTTPRCRSRWWSSRRRRGTALLGSSRQHVGFDREVELSRRRRDRPPRRALLPGPATTPARCACTPACAR